MFGLTVDTTKIVVSIVVVVVVVAVVVAVVVEDVELLKVKQTVRVVQQLLRRAVEIG